MMKLSTIFVSAIFIAGLLLSANAAAGSGKPLFQAGKMADGAPPELMHWGKLVGQWSTSEESLKKDGSGWTDAGSADWDLFWAYDGWGIQDNYTSPPKSQKLEDETKRQRGINLRVYNPESKKWALTWLTTKSSKAELYSATSDNEKVVMLSDERNANGKYSRISFFDMTDTSFEWKLEQSNDQESWLEVYRIHGSRKLAK